MNVEQCKKENHIILEILLEKREINVKSWPRFSSRNKRTVRNTGKERSPREEAI